MMRFFLRLFSICLVLGAALSLTCSPARAAEMAGQTCPNLGVTTMAADQQGLIACLKDTKGALVWKSMTDKAGSGVPVGAIIAWPVDTNPEDMQNADGTFNWLDCNGQGISSATYPELVKRIGGNVPDLRGLFLRGRGGNSGALTQVQTDLVGQHDHLVAIRDGDGGGSGTAAFDETNSPWGYVYFRTTAGNGMGVETRPINMAVRYLIRARS